MVAYLNFVCLNGREFTCVNTIYKMHGWVASAEKSEPASTFSADIISPYVFSVVIIKVTQRKITQVTSVKLTDSVIHLKEG